MLTIDNAIGGKLVRSQSSRTQPVYNPATGEQTATLPLATVAEVNAAVAAARAAFPAWAATTPMKRARILFRYKELLDRHADEIATAISREHGKVHGDALGEVARGIDCVEFACGIPHLLKGEFSRDADAIAMAMGYIHIGTMAGKLNGVMPATTPSGWRSE
jgi:malonate-semialdehyde dehydrogenase (acetylating)/methylmalonate-semialdehyde dehydrogenase